MKRYGVCPLKHVVVVENWNLNGYYMHKELPQDDAWRWNLGVIVGEVTPAGFCLSSIDPDVRSFVSKELEEMQRLTNPTEWRDTYSWDSGKAKTMDEARRKAIDAHALICEEPLEPLMVDGHVAGEGFDGYGNTVE